MGEIMYYAAKWVLDHKKINTIDDIILIIKQLAADHAIEWDYPDISRAILKSGLVKCVDKDTLEENKGLLELAKKRLLEQEEK
jgi:hypothetical protein